MTNKQPEALRLADWLDFDANICEALSAAELRRQHEELQNAYATIESLKDAVSRAQTEAARYANPMVIKQRDALLVALSNMLEVWPNTGKKPGWCKRWTDAQAQAREEIAKVKGSAA